MAEPRGIPGMGSKSDRTRALRMYHQEHRPIDAIAQAFKIPVDEARELVFGKQRQSSLARSRQTAPGKRTNFSRRQAISECSPAQREKVEDAACAVCRAPGPSQPAHLIDKSIARDLDGDPRRVVPLCWKHHREYDAEDLDLLPYLEPSFREELGHAVETAGLLSALFRISGGRWVQLDQERQAA